jgi:hypothetical protein
MKQINQYFFLPLIALVIFSSCEKSVTVDVPEKPSSLVINAILKKDQVIRVIVGKSRYILQSGQGLDAYVVKNAVPVIFENNIPIDTLVLASSGYIYTSPKNKTIRAGYTYTIKITAPGFSAAEATTIVPSQSEAPEVTRVKDARVTSDGVHKDEIIVKLNDPAEKNFYLLQFFQAPFQPGDEYTVYCASTTDKDLELVGDNADPLSTDNCYDADNLILRDDNFNGQVKQLRFYIESGILHDGTGVNGQTTKPYVRLSRITEEQFKFIKSFSVYNMAVDNPFAEPVNVFSNVKNGYGIFAAYTSATKDL